MKINKLYMGLVTVTLFPQLSKADLYTCVPCPASTYSKNGECISCPAGSYCSDGKKYPCPEGSYCSGGQKYTCPAGTYSSAGASSCSPCPYGEYQPKTGQSSCLRCSTTVDLSCTYIFCTPGGGHSGNGITGSVTVFGGFSSGVDPNKCPSLSGLRGTPGVKCIYNGNYLTNNSAGYITKTTGQYSYAVKKGTTVTVECNNISGNITKIEVK